jgi:hypothetical protein
VSTFPKEIAVGVSPVKNKKLFPFLENSIPLFFEGIYEFKLVSPRFNS